jgi:hypothetical protein
MSTRRAIAEWLCPQLAKDSQELWRLKVEMSDKCRWLGHDFPMVEVVISRLLVDSRNYMRSLDEPPMDLNYPHLGGSWPSDIYSFREKMRSTFGTFPTPRTDAVVGSPGSPK